MNKHGDCFSFLEFLTRPLGYSIEIEKKGGEMLATNITVKRLKERLEEL